jgi:hypothetical protein
MAAPRSAKPAQATSQRPHFRSTHHASQVRFVPNASSSSRGRNSNARDHRMSGEYDSDDSDDLSVDEQRPPKRAHVEGHNDSNAALQADYEERLQQEAAGARRAARRRPQLTTDDWMSDYGLVTIPHSFPARLTPLIPSGTNIAACARYSRTLLQSYHDMAHTLWPTWPADDVLWHAQRISGVAFKKYWQQVRNEVVRNPHVERVSGLEPAQRWFEQLESTMSEEQEHIGADAGPLLPRPADDWDTAESNTTLPVAEEPVAAASRAVEPITAARPGEPVAPAAASAYFDDSDEEELELFDRDDMVQEAVNKEPGPDEPAQINTMDEAGAEAAADNHGPAESQEPVDSAPMLDSVLQVVESSQNDEPPASYFIPQQTVEETLDDGEEEVVQEEEVLIETAPSERDSPIAVSKAKARDDDKGLDKSTTPTAPMDHDPVPETTQDEVATLMPSGNDYMFTATCPEE